MQLDFSFLLFSAEFESSVGCTFHVVLQATRWQQAAGNAILPHDLFAGSLQTSQTTRIPV